MIRSYTGMLDG